MSTLKKKLQGDEKTQQIPQQEDNYAVPPVIEVSLANWPQIMQVSQIAPVVLEAYLPAKSYYV